MSFIQLLIIVIVGYFCIFSLVSRICQCIKKIFYEKRQYIEKTFWSTEWKKYNEFNEEFEKHLTEIDAMVKEFFKNADKK